VPDTPLDLNVLGDFTGHDPVQTLRLARHFAETAGKTLVEIRAARDSGNLGALNRLGHKLKSSSAMAGARECASLCLQLEKCPDLPAALELAARLEPVITGIQDHVRELGERPAAS
jgi:HPt (histidine-containing phosphotransfer) domain-containing protein